jgi:hypothetical protein
LRTDELSAPQPSTLAGWTGFGADLRPSHLPSTARLRSRATSELDDEQIRVQFGFRSGWHCDSDERQTGTSYGTSILDGSSRARTAGRCLGTSATSARLGKSGVHCLSNVIEHTRAFARRKVEVASGSGTRSASGFYVASRGPMRMTERSDSPTGGAWLPYGMSMRGGDYLLELVVPDLDRYRQFLVGKLLRASRRLGVGLLHRTCRSRCFEAAKTDLSSASPSRTWTNGAANMGYMLLMGFEAVSDSCRCTMPSKALVVLPNRQRRAGVSTFRRNERDGRETAPFRLECFRLTRRVAGRNRHAHGQGVVECFRRRTGE